MHRLPAEPPPAIGKRLSSDIQPKSFAVTPKIMATGLKLREVVVLLFIRLLVVVVLLSFELLGFIPKQTLYVMLSQIWELFVHFFLSHSIFLESFEKVMNINSKITSITHKATSASF
jgi:hypothetical protein